MGSQKAKIAALKVAAVTGGLVEPRAQRLPQHVKEIVEGRDDARDVGQEAFCASTYKSGAGVLRQWLGGVMVASAVRGGLASVRFRAEPSGERWSTREPPSQVQPLFLHPHRRLAKASSRPSFAKVKRRSRTRTSKSRAISNLFPPPNLRLPFK